jgi:pimeloyl-ACP methyl ester carboxylesterase
MNSGTVTMADRRNGGSSLRLRDGPRLAYRVYGREGGRPIVFFHGFPGSSVQAALVHAQAVAADVELVAFDRPGFGCSESAPRPTVDSVIGDVAQLADHLGYRRFGVIGASCGGPYALASARLLRKRVTAVGLLAGAGPMGRPEAREGQSAMLTAIFRLARVHRWLVGPLLALDWLAFRAGAERAVAVLARMLTGPDRAILAHRPAVRLQFGASLAEAYRQGISGAMCEASRIARWSEADLRNIDVPVHVFQGAHDRHVPPAMGRLLAQSMPKGQLHLCADEGHLSIVVNRFDACARLVLQ